MTAVNSFWDFFWFILSFFVLMAYLVVLFYIVTDLFRDREVSGGVKAIWIFFLIIIPIITSLAYLISRGQGMADRNMAAAEAAQRDRENYIRSVSASYAGSPAEEIARAKALLDAGTIGQEDYDALKAKALA